MKFFIKLFLCFFLIVITVLFVGNNPISYGVFKGVFFAIFLHRALDKIINTGDKKGRK